MSSQGLQLTSKVLDVLLKNVWNVQGRGPRFCRGALCVLAASHVLARLRLLPDAVLRAIFLFHLIGTAVTTNVLIKGVDVLRALGILKNDTASGACAVITAAMFRWSRYGSPHMPVRLLPGSLPSFASMKTPNAVLVNHVGLFDTILYLWVVNPTYMMTMKTFYKAQLINVPLLGPILRSSQMLPVYFVTDRGDEFRVEKEKQIAVLKRTDEVLTAGWSISFYPEGAMNRSNPRNLQPFRFGTFNKIIEYKLNVYYMLHVGSEVTWPLGQSFGGRATPIYLYYGKIDVDYTADPTMDAQRLATLCQTQMQEKLDWMYSLVDSGKV